MTDTQEQADGLVQYLQEQLTANGWRNYAGLKSFIGQCAERYFSPVPTSIQRVLCTPQAIYVQVTVGGIEATLGVPVKNRHYGKNRTSEGCSQSQS